MFYIVNPKKLGSKKLRLLLREGDTVEHDVWPNLIRIDSWERVNSRHPGNPWKHMSDLYGKHEGETVLITGSGPSLKDCPVRPPVTTLAINRSIRRIQADYWLSHDADCYLDAKDHPHAQAAKKVFSISMHETLKGVPCTMIESNWRPERWKDPKTRPLYWNETTLGWAITLAMRMGAKRIVTIGTDLSSAGYWDGYLQPGKDKAWLSSQHYGVASRMKEMLSDDERPHWMDRPVEIVDSSFGAMPVPKLKLEDALAPG